MVRAGCCGWPVNRAEYFRRFSTIEINSTFYNPPQLATASRWRIEAPKGFEFSLKAWQLITHPSSSPTYRRLSGRWSEKQLSHCGHFAASDEVAAAWERTWAVAQALKSRFLLFQMPKSFFPSAGHLKTMYGFFKGVSRGKITFVWEPRGRAWDAKLVRRVCEDLGLVHAVDPLAGRQASGNVRYYRLHGRHEGDRVVYQHQYSDAELGALHTRCAGQPAFVYFNNAAMWDDACRFQAMAGPPLYPVAVKRGA